MPNRPSESGQRAQEPEQEITECLTVSEKVLRALSGPRHENLRLISERLQVRVGARGQEIHVVGPAGSVGTALHLLEELIQIAKKSRSLQPSEMNFALEAVARHDGADLQGLFLDSVFEARGGKKITPKTAGQKRYVDTIRGHDISFGVGPAGTGKTYLAMALAIAALKGERVARIILTRPAVEAGEKLGFLPGDLEAKVNPYLRPLYDALFDLIGFEETQSLLGQRILEIAPLAFMRGRTLNDAFVILDEGQNATREQMKMFLTRIGFGSTMVINGDLTQTDLANSSQSGLHEAVYVLEKTPGVGICWLNEADVVRHGIVQQVIRAYESTGRAPRSLHSDKRSWGN